MLTRIRRIQLTAVLVPCIWALWVSPTALRAQDSEPLEALFWDRLDENAVWRLADHIQTNDAGAPSDPKPVYMQFGFMGCAPCVSLALLANEELGDDVVKVYLHLDDVLVQQGYNNRDLWTALLSHTGESPYDQFIPLRRANTAQMESLCGAGANAPSGLLLLPSGEIFEVLRSPDEETALDAFHGFRTAVDLNLP